MEIYFRSFIARLRQIDWLLLISASLLIGAGLSTMSSFTSSGYFFGRQILWAALALFVFFVFSLVDWRFLRRGGVLVFLYVVICLALIFLVFVGQPVRGSQSWLLFGEFSVQPADFMKLVLILVLAKYFSRRHIEIHHIRHILISGFYALVPSLLILSQPDFGSAMIVFSLWLGMIMFSGVSKKHLFIVLGLAILGFIFLWFFVFGPSQHQRISTFFNPLADLQGAGYNAFQAMIAIGSGQLFGKGVGYGTQSRLKFLPEYQTDFIFAAFAEEWGFVGVVLLFFFFGLLIWRILSLSMLGETNFEALFGVGVAIWFIAHFIVGIGMNINLLPVTGLPLPLLSYGGSHLLAEFAALGILGGMKRYARAYHRDDVQKEFFLTSP